MRVVAAGMFAAASFTRAETCSLELKRLEPPGRSGVVFAASDYLLRTTYPQHIFIPIAQPGNKSSRIMFPENKEQTAAFKRIVKKEPKYACEQPCRGVAKLGGHEYPFVLDYVPPKEEADKAKVETEGEKAKGKDAEKDAKKQAKDAKSSSAIGALSSKIAEAAPLPESASSAPKATPYNRLYFDLNHNGDLTDDKVIEALWGGPQYDERGTILRSNPVPAGRHHPRRGGNARPIRVLRAGDGGGLAGLRLRLDLVERRRVS